MSTITPTTPHVQSAQAPTTLRAGEDIHLRTVEGIHRSTTFHWVGNGFLVSTAMDDGRVRDLSRGVPRGRFHPERWAHAHDAALGEPSQEGQDDDAGLSAHHRRRYPERARPRRWLRADHRRRVRRSARPGPHVHANYDARRALSKGTRLPVTLPASYNALAVVAEGNVRAGGSIANAGDVVLSANDAPHLELVAEEDAHVILLSGEPLDEPVVQYGPFVMNTESEIEWAMRDVANGKFGPIPD